MRRKFPIAVCVKMLAVAVIERAVQDYGSLRRRKEVREFLDSNLFEAICEALRFDPEIVRQRILAGKAQFAPLRADSDWA